MNCVITSVVGFSMLVNINCAGISDEFAIRIEGKKEDVDKVITESGFYIHKEFPYLERIYLLRPEHEYPSHTGTSLDKLLSHEKVTYLGAQRKMTRVRRTIDTEWEKQWALNDAVTPSMGVTSSWQLGYTGKGVKVAVVDGGIEATHPDLDDNVDIISSYDYYDDDTDASPSSKFDSHGTEIAGLAAAEMNNSFCIAGIAYAATLVSIRLLGEKGTTDAEEALSLNHNLSTIGIYINSWGPSDRFGFDGPGPLTSSAIQTGVEKGRNGKGAIYLWASGNGGRLDNCNADGYANSIFTITISSVDAGQRSPVYCEVCAATLACTYSGDGKTNLYSTSLNSSCSGYIGGTSYSVPQAAAIVALALEANSNLTWRDIQHLIVETSKSHNLTDNVNNWIMNGGGKLVSHLFGFGLMDAEDMVVKAKGWTNVPPQENCSTTVYIVDRLLSSKDVDSSRSKDTLNLAECTVRFIEHVTVTVNFTHDVHRGGLKINIMSPSGTVSKLLTERPLDSKIRAENGTLNWMFMSVHFWGENSEGTWLITLELTTGEVAWHSWSITVYGTSSPPLPGEKLQSTSVSTSNEGTVHVTTERNDEMKISAKREDNFVLTIAIIVAVTMVIITAVIFVFVLKVNTTRHKKKGQLDPRTLDLTKF